MLIDAARYFPHCPPEAAHTRCSTFTASSEYFGDRRFLPATATCLPPPGGRFAAAHSRRRALSLDHPFTPTTSSRIRPLSPFPAFTYVLAYFDVTSAREFIDSSVSLPNNDHRYAGIPT